MLVLKLLGQELSGTWFCGSRGKVGVGAWPQIASKSSK